MQKCCVTILAITFHIHDFPLLLSLCELDGWSVGRLVGWFVRWLEFYLNISNLSFYSPSVGWVEPSYLFSFYLFSLIFLLHFVMSPGYNNRKKEINLFENGIRFRHSYTHTPPFYLFFTSVNLPRRTKRGKTFTFVCFWFWFCLCLLLFFFRHSEQWWTK